MTFKDKVEETYPQQPFLFEFDSQSIIKRSKMIIKKSTASQTAIGTDLNCVVEPDKLFNEVINEMISLKKPIIVHNGFLDLMHVLLTTLRSTIDSQKIYPTTGTNTNRKCTASFPTSTITNTSSATHPTSYINSPTDRLAQKTALLV